MTQNSEDRLAVPPLRERLRAGWRRFRERNRRLDRAVGRAVAGSRLYRSVAGLEPVIHSSRVVEWFTTAPSPTVVTVDLNRTRTVGPLLRAIDRLTRPLGAVLRGSVTYRTLVGAVIAVERNHLRASSAFALGLLVAVVASTDGPAGLPAMGATVLVGVALALGLLVDRPARAFEESTAAAITSRVVDSVAPSEEEPR